MTHVRATCGGKAIGKSSLAHQLVQALPAVAIGTNSYIEPRATRTDSPNDLRSLHLDDATRVLIGSPATGREEKTRSR
jgi:hypothetical protein